MALTKINANVIANNTIAVGNIADNSVDGTKIASNSILTRHIDDNQITTDQIAANTIATANIADNAVDGTKIASNSILTRHIDDNQITTDQIAANTIATANVADNAINGTKILSNSIVTRHITSDQITGAELADNITIAGTLTSTGAFTSPGIDDNADAIAITIDSAEKVGIGETSPAAPLHVEHSSGTAYNGAAEILESLIVSNKNGSDDSGVNNVVSIGLHVADGATSQGFINYVRTGNNTGDFTFTQRKASSTYAEHMRIKSDGTTTIGQAMTTTYDNDQGYPLHIQGATGNQTYLAISVPGANSGDTGLVIGHDSAGTRIINREADPIIFHTNAGGETVRFIPTGGITFGGETADAHALDDYEEGTWQPSNNGTQFSTRVGSFTKIGDRVFCQFEVVAGSGSSSGDWGGLPFTIRHSSDLGRGGGVVAYHNENSSESWHVSTENVNSSSFSLRLGSAQKQLTSGKRAWGFFSYLV